MSRLVKKQKKKEEKLKTNLNEKILINYLRDNITKQTQSSKY